MNTPSPNAPTEELPSEHNGASYRGSGNVKIFMKVEDPEETYDLQAGQAPEESSSQKSSM
jgi:hypothetical protein